MKIEIFRKNFNRVFKKEINKLNLRIKRNLYKYNPQLAFISDQISKVLMGGKKVRPFLLFSIYDIFSPGEEKNKILKIKDILIALEIFHNFCLIHDDITDNGKFRHGTETINYFLIKKFFKFTKDKDLLTKFAESEALLVGDLIFKEVFYILDQHEWLNMESRFNFLREFYNMIDVVFLGQMLDIYLMIDKGNDLNLIKNKNILKTSYYSFVEPMKLGYILADGKDSYYFRLFEKIGVYLGLIYQIQDDIANVISDSKKIGKDTLSDIVNNQQTFLTFYLKKHLRSSYLDLREKIIKGEINSKKLVEIIRKCKCLDYAYNEIDNLKKKTLSIIKSIDNNDLLNFMEYLLNFVINRNR